MRWGSDAGGGPDLTYVLSPRMSDRVSRIMLLHGASSAGKSTLSKAIQRALDEPFLHLSSDNVGLGLPQRRDAEGPFKWWGGRVRPRFFDGFQRSIAAFAAAGNDLIVDHVIEFRSWREDLSRLLRPFDVLAEAVRVGSLTGGATP